MKDINDIKEVSIDFGNNVTFSQHAIGNNKYIIFVFNSKIHIYTIEKNKATKIYMKSFNYKITYLKLNEIHENIFLAASNNEINIFEIYKSINEFICEEKIKIKLNDNLDFVKFSEYNEYIIGTISNTNIIRLWDINLKFSFLTLKLKDSIVFELFFNKNKNLIMIHSKDKNNNELLSIYNISRKNYIKSIHINDLGKIYEISNSDFSNILYVNEKYIKLINTTEEKNGIKKLELNYEFINNVFYFKSINLLFLFCGNKCEIIDIKNLEFKKEVVVHAGKIFANYVSKDNNKMYINFLYGNKILTFHFDNINLIDDSSKVISSGNLFSKNYKIIYAKPELGFSNSIIEIDEIKKKNYLEINEIAYQLKENYGISLQEKRERVINMIKKYNKNDSIKNQYLFLLKLLIQDNTNKELLKIYLKFLDKNINDVRKIYPNVEDFNNEFKDYKVVFSPDEIYQNFKKQKKSEKEEFLNLLNKINNTSNQYDFKNLVKEYSSFNLGRFNQGIEFSNEELYWFRNKSLLIFSLAEMNYDTFSLMQYCIDKILTKKLFDNPVILKNYKYINFLVILIVHPLPKNYCDDNIKIIESILNENNKNIQNNENKILSISNKCRLIKNNNTLQLYNQTIQLHKIKTFLKKIFCSNVFQEAFQILYPSYINFPFKTEKNAEDYINKFINFIIFNSSSANSVTDKFTLETYIFLEPKEIKIKSQINKKFISLIEKILYTSGNVKTNFDELNHNLYNMFYYHKNGIIPLNFPRKDGEDEREEGREIEFLLFGMKVNKINMKEALYILNEENYNKSIIKFKEDFQKLNSQEENINDLIIKGEFQEYILHDDILNSKKKLIYIQLEQDSDYPDIDSNDDNDVLGRGINFNK